MAFSGEFCTFPGNTTAPFVITDPHSSLGLAYVYARTDTRTVLTAEQFSMYF